MKKIYYSLLIAASAALSACSDSKSDTPDQPTSTTKPGDVEVTISTASIETKAAKLEFASTDKMNVFAKIYNDPTSDDIATGICATYDGSKWDLSPKVYINPDGQKLAFVYAVSPYDAAYTNIKELPIDLAKQVDVLYSGTAVAASTTSPGAKLKMKHALSLATFNIVPVNYNGTGTLTSLTVSGDGIYKSATLDGTTGKFTDEEAGSVSGSFTRNVENGGWKSNIPGLWVLPFTTKGAVVTLEAVIDGKTYSVEMPEVEMKQAYQYIFRLALTNNGLEFDPSKTESISLNVDTDQAQEFALFGRLGITLSGSGAVAPVFNGDNVFGTTTFGGSAYSYKPLFEITATSGTAVVESWNSTGVEFTTLEGIDAIDFTEYE